MRWWSAAYGQSQRWEAEAAPKKLDVFGVGRPDATPQRSLLWTGLKPGADARVASVPGVDAVVCSGLGPNDVQVHGLAGDRGGARSGAPWGGDGGARDGAAGLP